MARKRELTLEFFKKQGSIGGKMGGKISWDKMTPEERSVRAQKAVAARKWHPVKPKDEASPAEAAPADEIPKVAARLRKTVAKRKKS